VNTCLNLSSSLPSTASATGRLVRRPAKNRETVLRLMPGRVGKALHLVVDTPEVDDRALWTLPVCHQPSATTVRRMMPPGARKQTRSPTR
jgi:hypothetical protein